MNGSFAFRVLGMAMFTMSAGSFLLACDGGTSTTSTSSSGGGGEGGTGGGSSSASNGERYAQGLCDRVFDCCNTVDLTEKLSNSGVVDYAGCRILYRSVWDAAIEAVVKEGEKAGRVSFDQAKFDSCMQSLSSGTCADLNNLGNICEGVFTPKVAVGQTCYTSLECVDGDCDIPSGAASGTCKAKPTPVGVGGACTSNNGCEKGLYCDGAMCVMQKADGAACTNDDECTSTACVGSPGKCQTVCQGGGSGPGTPDKALEPLAGQLALAQCEKAFDCCSGDEFDTILFPGNRTKAQCLAFYGIFGAIALVELHNSEAQGKLTVDPAGFQTCLDKYLALTCTDYAKGADIDCPDAIKGLIADGMPCTDDNQCTSNYCNESMPNQGTCAKIPGVGAPCTDTCSDGNFCNNGMCAAQKAVGSACTANKECAEGRCYGPNGMKTCSLICDGI